jgi:L-2-hydroxyglutarate oxidase LhgO
MEQGFGKMEQRSCRRMQQELDKMVLGTQALDMMELDKRVQQEQRSCRRMQQELDKQALGKMEFGTQALDTQVLRSRLWVC